MKKLLLILILSIMYSCEPPNGDYKLIEKRHTPMYTTIVMSGKTIIPITHYPSYNITLENKHGKQYLSVNREQYDSLEVNKVYMYTFGKLINNK